ncbi:MAG: MFS transporter [Firmicutes bacterium]|nr:MFS transporter [Bacillota bacterium]
MFKGFDRKTLMQFIILAFSGEVVFYVIFGFRTSYYMALLEVLGINNEQFGLVMTVYGWIAVVGYLVGGYLADKISTRVLMSTTFLSTSILYFIYGLFPSYAILMAVFIGFGFSTSFTYWAALQKATRIIGRKIGSESKAFGFLQTGRDLFGVFTIAVSVVVFNQIVNLVFGLRFVIWWFAAWLFIFGIVSIFVFDREPDPEAMSDKDFFGHLFECVKNPNVWLCTLMAYGGFFLGIGRNPNIVLVDILGMSHGNAAYVTSILKYLLLIGAFATAFIAQRFGPSIVLFYNTILQMLTAAATIYLLIYPNLYAYITIMVLQQILVGSFRCQKFATIREGRVPMHISGAALGFISFVIYTSDAWPYAVFGRWMDQLGYVDGLIKIHYLLIAMGMITIISTIVFRIVNKQNIKDVLEEEKQKRLALEG